MKRQSEASILLETHLKEMFGDCNVFKEFKFLHDRKFRFDFAVMRMRESLGIEIDGGVFSNGRHTRGVGFVRDMEKLNLAAVWGWKVLRFTPNQVLKGEARQFIKEWFCPIIGE